MSTFTEALFCATLVSIMWSLIEIADALGKLVKKP